MKMEKHYNNKENVEKFKININCTACSTKNNTYIELR